MGQAKIRGAIWTERWRTGGQRRAATQPYNRTAVQPYNHDGYSCRLESSRLLALCSGHTTGQQQGTARAHQSQLSHVSAEAQASKEANLGLRQAEALLIGNATPRFGALALQLLLWHRRPNFKGNTQKKKEKKRNRNRKHRGGLKNQHETSTWFRFGWIFFFSFRNFEGQNSTTESESYRDTVKTLEYSAVIEHVSVGRAC